MSAGNQLMFDVADYIAANPLGGNAVKVIPALAKDPSSGGYLQQGIDKIISALNGGLCVYVFLPMLGASKPDVPGPYFDKASVLVLVVEDQLVNNAAGGFAQASTPIRADDLALYIAKLFHGWLGNGAGYNFTCSFCNALSLANVPDEIRQQLKDRDLVFWGVMFGTRLVTDPLSRVATPMITVGSPNTSITIPSGATVYYTTDGTLPTPTNGTHYTTPFTTPASGTLIRSAAYKSGSIGSCIDAQEVP